MKGLLVFLSIAGGMAAIFLAGAVSMAGYGTNAGTPVYVNVMGFGGIALIILGIIGAMVPNPNHPKHRWNPVDRDLPPDRALEAAIEELRLEAERQSRRFAVERPTPLQATVTTCSPRGYATVITRIEAREQYGTVEIRRM